MIDIIIPAYNAHETIRKTLFSIGMQTLIDKIKVTIVDDASSKEYDYLIEEFKDKIDIQVVRQSTNKGPGAARNLGLDSTKNEYILFIDSDDLLVNPYSIESLVNNIEGYDLAIGILEMEDELGNINYYENHDRCLHAKLYRRSIIDKYKFRFNESYRHEDCSFHELYLYSDPKIVFVNEYVYLYRYNHSSLTHNNDGYKEFCNFKSFVDNTLWAAEEAYKRDFYKRFVIATIDGAIMYLYYELQKYYKESYKDEMYEWIKPLVEFYMKDKSLINEDVTIENYYIFQGNFYGIPYITYDDFISKSLDK